MINDSQATKFQIVDGILSNKAEKVVIWTFFCFDTTNEMWFQTTQLSQHSIECNGSCVMRLEVNTKQIKYL